MFPDIFCPRKPPRGTFANDVTQREGLCVTEVHVTKNIGVVYFDQLLSAAHSKYWSKYVFSMFFMQKSENGEKSKKIEAKLSKIISAFGVHSTQMLAKYTTCAAC